MPLRRSIGLLIQAGSTIRVKPKTFLSRNAETICAYHATFQVETVILLQNLSLHLIYFTSTVCCGVVKEKVLEYSVQ